MDKYTPIYTGEFKKSYKLCKKRGLNMELLNNVISILLESGTLPSEYSPHPLSGNYSGYMECHVQNDWLLIYKIYNNELVLLLSSTGTHADLFGINKPHKAPKTPPNSK